MTNVTLKHGQLKQVVSHYDNGQVKEELSFWGNLPHGTFKMFRKDGSLRSVTPYRHGRIHGRELWYNDEGLVEMSAHWVNGKEVSCWRGF